MAASTFCSRVVMLLARFCSILVGMLRHTATTARSRSFSVWISCLLICLCAHAHKFSMGFRSGLLAGQQATTLIDALLLQERLGLGLYVRPSAVVQELPALALEELLGGRQQLGLQYLDVLC